MEREQDERYAQRRMDTTKALVGLFLRVSDGFRSSCLFGRSGLPDRLRRHVHRSEESGLMDCMLVCLILE